VKFVLLIIALVLSIVLSQYLVATADAHYYDGCKKYTCKAHVIKPYKAKFRSIAHCETGGTMRKDIHNPSGLYHGLYQFDLRSWRGAGGTGDPHYQSYTEQTYRAVIWLHRMGRDAWPNC
jgi:hypothetical protein